MILPGCTHWQDPRFFAYFPSNSSLAAVLGDFLSTGLAQLGLNWQASPALTELEELTTDWLRQMLGLCSAWSGVIQDTASTATLVALICARERTSDHCGRARRACSRASGRWSSTLPRQSHSSVEKAALLAGFGRENVRIVAVDDRYGMSAEALRKAVAEDAGARARTLRDRRHGWIHRHHRDRPSRGARGRRTRTRPLAARRCRDGGLRDDSPGVPRRSGRGSSRRTRWC